MKLRVVLFLLLFSHPLYAEEIRTDGRISELFKQSGVQGTFVVYAPHSNQYIVHSPQRAKQRFVPASTFKVAHSLIGLSVRAVKDVEEVLPYGGKPQPLEVWERDMGLREAIKLSNVPIYQELARRIGLEQMRDHIQRLRYGNYQIGSVVDTFWLVGPLKISAIEQTQFLAKLAQSELGYSESIQASVKDIIRLDQRANFTLYGKTGWSQGVGWWVGWVEKADRIYSFAINIDMTQIQDAPKRVKVGKESLKILGLISSEPS